MKNAVALSNAIEVPGSGPTAGWRSQFQKPSGMLGRAVGHLMAFRNKERRWSVLPVLDIHRHDCVLEVGFGSRIHLRPLSALAVDRFVADAHDSRRHSR